MDALNFYFRQLVLESDLDLAFQQVRKAVQLQSSDSDLALHGMITGGAVAETAPQSLAVDVVGNGIGYSPDGKRIAWTDPEEVDCSQDYQATPTTVTTPGNMRWLSVFVEFDEDLQDLRLDGNGFPVYYKMIASHNIFLVMGAEGVSPAKPPLRPEALLLADIQLAFGAIIIINANINEDRRQDYIRETGNPRELNAGTIRDTFIQLLGYYNDHVRSGTADRHSGEDIDFAGYDWLTSADLHGAWEDFLDDLSSPLDGSGTGRIGYRGVDGAPGGSGGVNLDLGFGGLQLQSVLDDLHSQLTDTEGAGRIGADGRVGVDLGAMPIPATLAEGSVAWQLGQLVDFAETLRNTSAIAATTSFVPYAWISSTNVQDAIEEITIDLQDDITPGASRIGMVDYSFVEDEQPLDAWLQALVDGYANETASGPGSGSRYIGFEGYSWLPADSVYDTFVNVVGILGSQGATSGATRIGFNTFGWLSDGTVQETFEELITELSFTAAGYGTNYIGHQGYAGAASSAAPNYSLVAANLKTTLDSMMLEINKRVARAGDRMYGDLVANSSTVDLGSIADEFGNLWCHNVNANAFYWYNQTSGPEVFLYFGPFGFQWSEPNAIGSYGSGFNLGFINCDGGDEVLLPLHFPAEGIIKNVELYGYSTQASNTIDVRLTRRVWNASSGTYVENSSADQGIGYFTRDFAVSPEHSVVANNIYWLALICDYDTRVYGVRLIFEFWPTPDIGRGWRA